MTAKSILLSVAVGIPVMQGNPQPELPRVRTIELPAGIVRVERADDGDRVTLTARDGSLSSRSVCAGEGISYDTVVRFYVEFQKRIAAGDRIGVAQMVDFPLRVNTKPPERIQSRDELLRRFSEVFTPAVIASIGAAEPRIVFCKSDQAMLGSGVVWSGVRDRRLRIISVNP